MDQLKQRQKVIKNLILLLASLLYTQDGFSSYRRSFEKALNSGSKPRSIRAKDTKKDDIKFRLGIGSGSIGGLRVGYSYNDDFRIFVGNSATLDGAQNGGLAVGAEFDPLSDESLTVGAALGNGTTIYARSFVQTENFGLFGHFSQHSWSNRYNFQDLIAGVDLTPFTNQNGYVEVLLGFSKVSFDDDILANYSYDYTYLLPKIGYRIWNFAKHRGLKFDTAIGSLMTFRSSYDSRYQNQEHYRGDLGLFLQFVMVYIWDEQ